MKKLLISLVFVFIFWGINAQNTNAILSNDAEISLLTCGPGNDLYSVFGHSALRVSDPKLGIDAIFNYGTFQFTDDFYFKFTTGKLNYMLSVSIYKGFISSYIYENRDVIEQQLNLSQTQKQKLFKILLTNNKPENRYYLYDFFYNNCSTQLRDKLLEAAGNDLTFIPKENQIPLSFRQNLDGYLTQMDWSDFGIDLALGLPCDKNPNHLEDMFLPDELMNAFDRATIKINNTQQPLVKKTRVLYEAIPFQHRFPYYMRPVNLSWFLLFIVLILTIVEARKQANYIYFDKVFFAIIGFFGLFLLFLWLGTDHTATAKNLNILWANPLLFFACFFPFKKPKKWLIYFFIIIGVFSFLLIATWQFLPQKLHFAAMPLAIIVGIRSLMFYIKNKFKKPIIA